MFIDNSPPLTGSIQVVTPETPGLALVPKLCQRSVATIVATLQEFHDPESGIERFV